MAIALEKKVAEKEVEVLLLKDWVKLTEEKLQQSTEREGQTSAKLTVAEAKNVELEKQLCEEKIKHEDLTEKNAKESRRLTAQVEHYKSARYTKEVIDLFQKSEDYQTKLFAKAFVFYNWGAAHVLRQFHRFIPDKKLMWKVFEGSNMDK